MSGKLPPHPLTCLTRREFKVCWGIIFCSRAVGYENSYPLDQYATPGSEGPTLDILEMFYRTFRMLNLRYEYHFDGVYPMPDGEISFREIEPRNAAFIMQFKSGQIPDPPSALEMAMEDDQLLSSDFDMAPLRSCLDDVRSDVKLMLKGDQVEAYKEHVVRMEAMTLGRQMIDEAIEDGDKQDPAQAEYRRLMAEEKRQMRREKKKARVN